MQLGAFSVSLTVKDIGVSKVFYEKLGFIVFGGDQSQNWLIIKNGSHTIGLFQGMFDKNILTFNPGWDNNAQQLKEFTDIRALQYQLKDQDVKLISEADENTTGPASLMIADPDGNMIFDRSTRVGSISQRGLESVFSIVCQEQRLVPLFKILYACNK
jgi:hypothetical protein